MFPPLKTSEAEERAQLYNYPNFQLDCTFASSPNRTRSRCSLRTTSYFPRDKRTNQQNPTSRPTPGPLLSLTNLSRCLLLISHSHTVPLMSPRPVLPDTCCPRVDSMGGSQTRKSGPSPASRSQRTGSPRLAATALFTEGAQGSARGSSRHGLGGAARKAVAGAARGLSHPGAGLRLASVPRPEKAVCAAPRAPRRSHRACASFGLYLRVLSTPRGQDRNADT